MEELEERVKRMDDQLQCLSRGEQLPHQTVRDFRYPGPAPSPNRNLGPDDSEPGEEGGNPTDARSPDDEAFQTGHDMSDQPSYVLRAQDGKMRFYGQLLSFLLTVGS